MYLLFKNSIIKVCYLSQHVTKDFLTHKTFEQLAKIHFEFCLRAWKKVNRFYFSFGFTRVGSHTDYSSRGRLFHTGKDRLSLEQYLCVIKSSIVLVFQVYPPLYKEYNFTNFSIILFSLWISNLPSRCVWCFPFHCIFVNI